MNITTIPFIYITLTLAALSSIGLLITSIAVKTRERLNGVLWGLLGTLGLWIIPFVVAFVFDCSVGLEIILFFFGALIAAVIMIATLIIALLKRQKKEPAEKPEKQLWLYAYIAPIAILLVFFCVDIYNAQTADIIVLERNNKILTPNTYYAITTKHCEQLGVGTKAGNVQESVVLIYDTIHLDYDTPDNPYQKVVLYVDNRLLPESVSDITKNSEAIMQSSFIQQYLHGEEKNDIELYDLYNTGYFWVRINMAFSEDVFAVFYKGNFIEKTTMIEPHTIYISD